MNKVFKVEKLSLLMMLLYQLLVVISHSLVPTTSLFSPPQPLTFSSKLFTRSESNRIVTLFKSTLTPIPDIRPSLGVNRTNYHAADPCSPDYKFILTKLNLDPKNIEFILLHQFNSGGFFDWHVDCSINDNTRRTTNVNVMLSSKIDGDYDGGELQVGETSFSSAEIGDAYSYPASFPHKVGDLRSGERHTLVIACRSALASPSPTDQPNELLEPNRKLYWDAALANLKKICSSPSLRKEAKLHLIFGEFLEKMGGMDEMAKREIATSYAVSGQGEEYIAHFEKEGEAEFGSLVREVMSSFV